MGTLVRLKRVNCGRIPESMIEQGPLFVIEVQKAARRLREPLLLPLFLGSTRPEIGQGSQGWFQKVDE
jgi:hypothetical protein